MKPLKISGSGCGRRIKLMMILLVLILGPGVVGCQRGQEEASEKGVQSTEKESAEGTSSQTKMSGDTGLQEANAGTSLPRLLDLGAGKCIPCKMMAPILEELREEHKGKLEVVFIDVWENPDAGGEYGIGMIPTQIFFDASGKEVFRHEGFISKEDILAKWGEMGVDVESENVESENED